MQRCFLGHPEKGNHSTFPDSGSEPQSFYDGQGEIRCFATVSTQKGRKNDSHKMLQVNIG